jgi:hypothetical protein
MSDSYSTRPQPASIVSPRPAPVMIDRLAEWQQKARGKDEAAKTGTFRHCGWRMTMARTYQDGDS